MKKSLLALSILSTFANLASAQVVRLYGAIDLNAQAVSNTGSDRRLSMGQDGLNQSQLVFAGREDLGGALYAGFVLNSGFNADTGIGLVYNLSKRTALYTTYAHLDNGSRSNNSLIVGSGQAASPTAGGTSSAFQLGARHLF